MKKAVSLFTLTISVILVGVRCGNDAATTTLITNLNDAITSNPNSTPSEIDSASTAVAISHSQSSKRARSHNVVMVDDATALDFRLVKAAGSGTSFGTVTGYQCQNNTLEDYFTADITNNTDGTATYAMTIKQTDGEGVADDMAITKTMNTNGTGSIALQDSTSGLAITFIAGSTNTLASSAGWAFAWNSAGLACGKLNGGTGVPFSFTVTASTKEKTGAQSSSDTSLCASVPTVPTYTAPDSTLTGWDCAAVSGGTSIAIAEKVGLEDDGGTDCVDVSGFYSTSSIDPATCGSDEAYDDMLCRLNVYYSLITRREKSVKRSLQCAMEGIFQRIKAGTYTVDAVTQTGTLDLYSLNVPIQAD